MDVMTEVGEGQYYNKETSLQSSSNFIILL